MFFLKKCGWLVTNQSKHIQSNDRLRLLSVQQHYGDLLVEG